MAKTYPNATVHLRNPETGGTEMFTPDDELPGWAVTALKEGNPSVLEPRGDEDLPPVPGPSQMDTDAGRPLTDEARARFEEEGREWDEPNAAKGGKRGKRATAGDEE